MCGDDRLSDVNRIYDSYISTRKELSIKTDKYENVISNLKINTGKGRTEGVSGTAVRKSIINNDKSAFEKIMPKGTGVLFDEFIESYKAFKDKLLNLIKENQMMSLKDYVSSNEKILSLDNYILENLN
jgi:predicted nucleotidyltransferase